MSGVLRIGQADVLAIDANGRLTSKGKSTMPTNPKAMPPSLLGREMNEITTRAEARGHFTPQELARYEELAYEAANKEWIAKEAKLADIRKIGVKMRREDNQKRANARNVHEKIISRSGTGTQGERSAAIKERHAKLRSK